MITIPFDDALNLHAVLSYNIDRNQELYTPEDMEVYTRFDSALHQAKDAGEDVKLHVHDAQEIYSWLEYDGTERGDAELQASYEVLETALLQTR